MIKPLVFLAYTLFGMLSLMAEPTEEREWTSTAKTSISGRAIALTNGSVELETTDGRKLKVPLDKLIAEDQLFIKKHFMGKLPTLPELTPPADLPFTQGEIHGPIDAGDGSSYFLYLPKSLSQGYKAPLFFWTGSSQSKPSTLKPFIKAAELTGMILATSVESNNKNRSSPSNVQHSGNCLEHMMNTLPIEKGRVFFSGDSGGGAVAFLNANSYKCSGVFAYISYMPDSKTPKNGDYVYTAGGAWDYNRYLSAFAARSYGEDGTHRLYPGGHRSERNHVAMEGICWLYSRELYDNLKDREEERQRFEARFSSYLREELVPQYPHYAYFWCDHFLNLCKTDGPLGETLQDLSDELAPTQQRYLDGRKALDEFSREQYADLGRSQRSESAHTTKKIQSAAQKLEAEFGDVIEIGDTARELGKETQKF